MLWPFGKPAKLLRLINRLCFYNDKCIYFADTTPEEIQAERAARLAKVKELVAAIGPESFPSAFLHDLESGEVATDGTGQYIDLLKAHFSGRRAS